MRGDKRHFARRLKRIQHEADARDFSAMRADLYVARFRYQYRYYFGSWPRPTSYDEAVA